MFNRPTQPRPLALLCNPRAGKGRAKGLLQQIEKILSGRGILFSSFSETWPATLDEFGGVWLIGGDGSLNHFINRYDPQDLPIALFKGGSANDFAWKLYGDLGLPAYLDRAIRAAPRRVDAGLCNGRFFLNGVGIGFDGAVVRAMGGRKWVSAGHLSYLLTVLRKIFFYRERELEIVAGARPGSRELFMLSVANGSRYGGGFLVAPQACIDDGQLDLVCIGKISARKRFRYIPQVKRGIHLRLPFVDSEQVKFLQIKSAGPMEAHVDGEPIESDQFDIRILPGRYLFLC